MTEMNKIVQKVVLVRAGEIINDIELSLPKMLSDVVSVEDDLIHNKTWIHTKYDNGYGSGIVKGPGTYADATFYGAGQARNRVICDSCYEEDKWEVTVIWYDGDVWHLCYDTPITNDVVGWLDDTGVIDICRRIKELPPA